MNFRIFSYILIINFYGAPTSARKLDVLLRSIRLNVHDNELITYHKLDTVTYKKHKAFHIEVEFSRPLEAVEAKMVIFTPRQKLPIISLNIDGCQAIRKDVELPYLVKMIADALRDGSVLPECCPIPAKQRIIIERFYINPSRFPSYTPEINTFVNFSCAYHKKLIISIYAQYEFKWSKEK